MHLPQTHRLWRHMQLQTSWVCKSFCWARTYRDFAEELMRLKTFCCFFFFLWGMKLWALFHRTWRPMKDNTPGSELFIFHFKQIMLAAMRRLKATWLEPERFLESKWLRQVKDEAPLAGLGIRWPGTERHRKSLWAERRGRRENDSSLTQAERHFLVLFTFKL